VSITVPVQMSTGVRVPPRVFIDIRTSSSRHSARRNPDASEISDSLGSTCSSSTVRCSLTFRRCRKTRNFPSSKISLREDEDSQQHTAKYPSRIKHTRNLAVAEITRVLSVIIDKRNASEVRVLSSLV